MRAVVKIALRPPQLSVHHCAPRMHRQHRRTFFSPGCAGDIFVEFQLSAAAASVDPTRRSRMIGS
jgi:hypothetical protein